MFARMSRSSSFPGMLPTLEHAMRSYAMGKALIDTTIARTDLQLRPRTTLRLWKGADEATDFELEENCNKGLLGFSIIPYFPHKIQCYRETTIKYYQETVIKFCQDCST